MLFLFTAGASYGESYAAKDVLFSVGFLVSPVELGSDWGEVNVQNATLDMTHDAKLGEPGLGFDLQAFYFLHPRLALGLDFSSEWFLEEYSSGWWVDGATQQQRYFAAARIFINPEDSYKLYLALGAGIAHTKMTMEFDSQEDFKDTGFGYYAGIGVEKQLGPHWAIGLEARYNGNKFDDTHLAHNGNIMHVYKQANYLSAVLRMNYKL